MSSGSNTKCKRCDICQAPTRCANYGATACEACKVFFRRAYLSGSFKLYRCFEGNKCVIDEGNRSKSCHSCRFHRCLEAGMKACRIRTERVVPKTSKTTTQVVNHKSASGTTTEHSTSISAPSLGNLTRVFSTPELFQLDSFWSRYSYSFYNIPLSDEITSSVDPYSNREMLLSVVSSLTRRNLFFSDLILSLTGVDPVDKITLFKNAFSEVLLLSMALAFDQDRDLWLSPINKQSKFLNGIPAITSKRVEECAGRELYEGKRRIVLAVQKCRPDEITIMLLFCTLLYDPAAAGLKDAQLVREKQNYFAHLLKKYLTWGFGESQGSSVIKELVSTVRDFRRTGRRLFHEKHGPLLKCLELNSTSLGKHGLLRDEEKYAPCQQKPRLTPLHNISPSRGC